MSNLTVLPAPIGAASPQTRATAKYQKRVGMATRSYNLKATMADAFRDACKSKGESQAAVLTTLMTAYTEGRIRKAAPQTTCWLCRLKKQSRQGR